MKVRQTLAAAALALGASLGPAAVAAHDLPRVVSFDFGSLDTLDALGLGDQVVAVPKGGLPDYLSQYSGDAYPDAGNLKSPDVEAVRGAAPDLILVTGRQGDAVETLDEIAETVNVGLEDGAYLEAVSANVLKLAERFHARDQAETALAELRAVVEKQRDRIDETQDVLVVTHNDGHFGLRHEPVVYDLLGLAEPVVPDDVESVTRGTRTFTPLTPDVIARMAPDHLMIVDRSAAIGAGQVDLDALKQQLGGAVPAVTVLNPGLWYLSGNGLESVRLQVEEVVQAL
ncbi:MULTISPECIES: ABC transporter substrate-binding protein [Marinobacter]|uniref:ABC transporter substrate-binding protein n=1 Tax=Marinobacter TaxID=2742 RepID=UPI000DAE75F0|nr:MULTISPECIES: ABC transporter substrate-binding protein [Marinobacter]